MKMLNMKRVVDAGINKLGIDEMYKLIIGLDMDLELKYIKLKMKSNKNIEKV